MFLLSIVESSTTASSNVQVFKNIIGTIVSPNYPNPYGNDEEQYYQIIAPMLTEIVLIFISFDVEYEEDCDYDYLEASTVHL